MSKLVTIKLLGRFPYNLDITSDEWNMVLEYMPFTIRIRSDPAEGVITLIETSEAGAQMLIDRYGAVKVDIRKASDGSESMV